MKKYKGMTLVSVIVAFTILLIGITMFYTAIQISSNIVSTQKKRIEATEGLINKYYLVENDAHQDESNEQSGSKLTVTGLSGYDYIEIKKYKISNDSGVLYYYGKK